jgi:polyferredoxin
MLRPLLGAGAEASAARRGDMSNQKRINLVLVILAVIGAIAVVTVLGMWLMHVTMMGGMMGCGGLFVGFLIIAALVTAGIVLVRRKERP